ncbi:MAG: type VI secretion system tube protein Hcp [Lentisphaerae bacterium]|nr:type VI secretion system tube protein Hcp [Lentisphaerota bacterium]MCP4101007.1 type VI secretion system tube protein Hcp [Lentisphaerota bacterium]
MAFSAYIKIDGIEGQSMNSDHKDWIDVTSFTCGANQETKKGSSMQNAGDGTMAPLVFTHGLDKATAKLVQACMQGEPIASAEFHVCAMIGGKRVKIYEVKFKNVTIVETKLTTVAKGQNVATDDRASLYTASQSENKALEPVEIVSLAANGIEWNFTSFGPDGSALGATPGSWKIGQGTT